MRYTPYAYQDAATRWILEHPRCGLFLDMGLGKTVVTLTAVRALMDDCEVERTLVVAPKKVAEATWTAEADKWDHLRGLRTVLVAGTEKQRLRALDTPADVYVIGRDSFVWLSGLYGGMLPFDMLVIDELTGFKSPKSQRFKAMRLSTPSVGRVVGLTGSPAPNGLQDLWAQIYCLDMGERLGRSVTRYREKYFDQHRWNNIVVRCVIRPGCERLIRDRIADICLSMRAEDYLQLPAMMVHTVPVRLPAAVRERYARFERERVLEFLREHEGEPAHVLAGSAAGLMNKLSQFANGAVYDEAHEAHEVHGEKLDRLAEIVEGAAGGGVLVFYQYRHDADRIMRRLKDVRTEVYEGPRQLEDWNGGRIGVLLAHPASTAYGLNMQQGGHYIVWFGTGWNLELYQQANARLHRQGQRCPVTVYNLLCEGTVDERAWAALESKKGVQQALLDSLAGLAGLYAKTKPKTT